jgi:hypothetical protein
MSARDFDAFVRADTNPWRAYPRGDRVLSILKQQDILQQFMATCRQTESGTPRAQLPWDLLIVDEAHNLPPAHFSFLRMAVSGRFPPPTRHTSGTNGDSGN